MVSSLLSPSDAELEILKKNSTKSIEVDLENMKTENEFEAPYYLVYCVGAVTAAVVAVVYFFLYHCCLKKKCFAPLYRSDHNGVAHGRFDSSDFRREKMCFGCFSVTHFKRNLKNLILNVVYNKIYVFIGAYYKAVEPQAV